MLVNGSGYYLLYACAAKITEHKFCDVPLSNWTTTIQDPGCGHKTYVGICPDPLPEFKRLACATV